jgi:hypothetical protein
MRNYAVSRLLWAVRHFDEMDLAGFEIVNGAGDLQPKGNTKVQLTGGG